MHCSKINIHMKGLSNPLFSGHPSVGINPLLERDLLTKIGAHIHFAKTGISVTDQNGEVLIVLTISLVDKNKLFVPPCHLNKETVKPSPKWAPRYSPTMGKTREPRLAIYCPPPPLKQLKAGTILMHVKQYPKPREAKQGIIPHIKHLRYRKRPLVHPSLPEPK